MRTGRTHENTNLNVRARHRNDEPNPYMVRRLPTMATAPSSYTQTRYHYDNGQYNSTRPTAIRRLPPSGIQCVECRSTFHNPSARFCSECGARR